MASASAQATGSSQHNLHRNARGPNSTAQPFEERRGFIIPSTGRRQQDPHSLAAQQHRQLRHLRDVLQEAWEFSCFFHPTYGWLSFAQAQGDFPSWSSNRAHRRKAYKNWDYPSEDALGPQYCLQYSDRPRSAPQRPRVKEESPKLSRTKEEPLDRNTPDVKPQVNPWVKYSGPSPFIQRPGMFRAPSTLKPLEVKGAFISPQPERELSSDEDETSGKQTKQHLVASSKRPSLSDGAEGRRLKRARRFV